jgi:hypothetical protein
LEDIPHDNDWWNDVMYPENLRIYEFITNINNTIDRKPKSISLVIEIGDTSNIINLRNVYRNFLRGTFISLIGKLVNLYTFKKDEKRDESSPFCKLLMRLHETPTLKPILAKISVDLADFNDHAKIVHDSRSKDLVVATQNIIWYTSKMLDFFVKALWHVSGATTPNLVDLELALPSADDTHKRLILDMIHFLIGSLSDYLEVNYFDIESLKRQVEVLREKRKEEEMAKYSKDDEERNLQIILRNMGLGIMGTGVADLAPVLEGEEAAEAAEPVLPVVPEYGEYVTYEGENKDDDADFEGYD